MKAGDLLTSAYARNLDQQEWKDFARSMRQARGHSCERCRRTDVELHVHHWFYRKDRLPWEYSWNEVAVLCRACHKSMHECLDEFRQLVFPSQTVQSFRVLTRALAVALTNQKIDPLIVSYAIAEIVSSPGAIERMAKAWIESKPQLTAP